MVKKWKLYYRALNCTLFLSKIRTLFGLIYILLFLISVKLTEKFLTYLILIFGNRLLRINFTKSNFFFTKSEKKIHDLIVIIFAYHVVPWSVYGLLRRLLPPEVGRALRLQAQPGRVRTRVSLRPGSLHLHTINERTLEIG